MRIGRNVRNASLIAAVIAAVATPGTPVMAQAGPAQTFYERSFVLAADARCGLFAGPVRAALDAAAWQARGAALRGGAGEPDLAARAARARARASATACDDADLAVVRARVEQAFSGWSRLARMTFEAGRASWRADRYAFTRPGWRLMQAGRTGASPVRFGYVGQANDERLTAVVSFVGAPRPYAARVVMRDARLSARPWPGALPPEGQRMTIWSSGVAPAVPGLTEANGSGDAWTFPAELGAALARLDPREPFVIEFMFRDDSVARARYEAGDFAAGRAFLAMGPV